MPSTRLTDPATSRLAADSVKHVTAQQRAILRILVADLIDEELVTRYNTLAEAGLAPKASPSGIRSRRSELVYAGLVADTGRRAKMSTGRNGIVWGLTEEGYATLND